MNTFSRCSVTINPDSQAIYTTFFRIQIDPHISFLLQLDLDSPPPDVSRKSHLVSPTISSAPSLSEATLRHIISPREVAEFP